MGQSGSAERTQIFSLSSLSIIKYIHYHNKGGPIRTKAKGNHLGRRRAGSAIEALTQSLVDLTADHSTVATNVNVAEVNYVYLISTVFIVLYCNASTLFV
jgi:hypothetical protein